MEMSAILQFPDKKLRMVAKKVTKIDKAIKKKMGILKETLEGCKNGAGLAATQMGFEERMIAVKRIKDGKIQVLVNPEITAVWGKKEFLNIYDPRKNKDEQEEEFMEGCLSFPGIFGTVKRYVKIEVRWEGGGEVLNGFEAILIQHEIDHLNGILLIDRIKESGGKIYRVSGEKKEEIGLADFVEQ